MESLWNDVTAARCDSELQLRAYTSRLLGGEGSLVLHGGGNTSLKRDEDGTRVLHVKGTGSDLARVDEHAFTPLRLDSVLQLLQRDNLDNGAMMRALEGCYLRSPVPRPSIETLLHAGLPYRHVEHTHADAVLAVLNVDTIETVHAEVFGDRAPLVPYHHSGHALARACIAAFAASRTSNTIGLILAFHGVVAFGDDARSAYENMIELVTRAEDFLRANGAWEISDTTPTPLAAQHAGDDDALRQLHERINTVASKPLHMHPVNDSACLAFARRSDLAVITQQGPATPQHAVYTKRVPLIDRDVEGYAARYRCYLDEHLGKNASAQMDTAPRIVLDPAWGMCAFGTSEREARIAAEMYQHDIAIISRASTHGDYRSAPVSAVALAEYAYGGYAARAEHGTA